MERYQTGRFYNSFVVKMIRDFFFFLLLLVIEVAVKLCIALYNYHNDKQEDTQQAADQLFAGVQDIMLISGGPVASLPSTEPAQNFAHASGAAGGITRLPGDLSPGE